MEYLNPLLQRSRFTEESNEFRKPFSSDCQQFEVRDKLINTAHFMFYNIIIIINSSEATRFSPT